MISSPPSAPLSPSRFPPSPKKGPECFTDRYVGHGELFYSQFVLAGFVLTPLASRSEGLDGGHSSPLQNPAFLASIKQATTVK